MPNNHSAVEKRLWDSADELRVFRMIFVLSEKNDNLRRTRDLLLPRLISGEVDVSDLDIDVRPLSAV